MRILLDTGPLVALLYRRERYHQWSARQVAELPKPFYCCEAVLTEAHFLLSSVPMGTQRLVELVARDGIDFSFSYTEDAERVGALMMRYADVPMSFADACLVCMAEQANSTILTFDSDFRIYRKHRDQALQVIMP